MIETCAGVSEIPAGFTHYRKGYGMNVFEAVKDGVTTRQKCTGLRSEEMAWRAARSTMTGIRA